VIAENKNLTIEKYFKERYRETKGINIKSRIKKYGSSQICMGK